MPVGKFCYVTAKSIHIWCVSTCIPEEVTKFLRRPKVSVVALRLLYARYVISGQDRHLNDAWIFKFLTLHYCNKVEIRPSSNEELTLAAYFKISHTLFQLPSQQRLLDHNRTYKLKKNLCLLHCDSNIRPYFHMKITACWEVFQTDLLH